LHFLHSDLLSLSLSTPEYVYLVLKAKILKFQTVRPNLICIYHMMYDTHVYIYIYIIYARAFCPHTRHRVYRSIRFSNCDICAFSLFLSLPNFLFGNVCGCNKQEKNVSTKSPLSKVTSPRSLKSRVVV